MTHRLLPLLAAALLCGCATFEKTELRAISARGVSPAVMTKLDRGHPLTIPDVVELSRRGVRDEWIVRQLEDQGMDSIVTRTDVAALRRAKVHQPVIEAVIKASDLFSGQYRYGYGFSYGPGFYGGPYDDSFGYYGDPWYGGPWYGGVGAAVVLPGYRHRYHHGHHR